VVLLFTTFLSLVSNGHIKIIPPQRDSQQSIAHLNFLNLANLLYLYYHSHIPADNIISTSGMQTCTSIIVEVSHHKNKTIAVDTSFLSKSEWKDELGVLLQDLNCSGCLLKHCKLTRSK
jgi:hypothetical protein